ncbi:MAG: CPBP family intramembrane glutamic endopeptidase [Terriglobales bacterium]
MRRQITGVLLAIAITTAMDALGASAFSALPLFPLMGLFWYLDRLPARKVGFARGRWGHYGLAILYPLLVLGAAALFALAAGAVETGATNWEKARLNLIAITTATILVSIVTEEGFFRGWLWASLEQLGWKESRILVGTSVAFSIWHLSAVSLPTGFDLPAAQVPIYLLNAAIIGANWGMLRLASGSLIVAAVSHGVWNGLAYVFFGFGTRVGALGVKETSFYGPEVGILGVLLNLAFAAALWWWLGRERARSVKA